VAGVMSESAGTEPGCDGVARNWGQGEGRVVTASWTSLLGCPKPAPVLPKTMAPTIASGA